MNRIAFSALAVCAAGSLSFANESEDWLTLDKEIETLATSLPQGGSGFAVSGFLRTSYQTSSDVIGGTNAQGDNNDLGGFSLDNMRVNFDGAVGDFTVHISVDGSPGFFHEFNVIYGESFWDGLGALATVDAFAGWNFTDTWYLEAGQFRTPFLASSARDQNELIFMGRSVAGQYWSMRDEGVLVGGAFDMIGVEAAIQNGVDDQGDELAFSLRVDWDVLGGGVPENEGAYGAPAGNALTLGGAYYDDGGITDGSAFGLDAQFVMGPFSAWGEMVANNDGLGIPLPGGGSTAGSSNTPWNLGLAFLFAGTWEAAGRYQTFDDTDSSSAYELAINKYMEGHDAKFILQYSSISSDDAAFEVSLIALGMTVSV